MTCTKSYIQNSALIIVIGLYEPYHDISSVSISNKTDSIARKLCWSTTPASRCTRGSGQIIYFFLLLLQPGYISQ